jgi:hypothetical protein
MDLGLVQLILEQPTRQALNEVRDGTAKSLKSLARPTG